MTIPAIPKTLCVDCIHHNGGYCKASPRPTAIDPVSGKTLPYREVPGSRKFLFGVGAYKLCCDMNTGDCPRFNRAESRKLKGGE